MDPVVHEHLKKHFALTPPDPCPRSRLHSSTLLVRNLIVSFALSREMKEKKEKKKLDPPLEPKRTAKSPARNQIEQAMEHRYSYVVKLPSLEGRILRNWIDI
jgi:hypothetical protein